MQCCVSYARLVVVGDSRLLQTVRAAIQLVRPAQWVKNIFVFGALVFGHRRNEPAALTAAVEAFLIFCILSGSVYAFNDLLDYKEDALHPTKRRRPVASGALSPGLAGVIAVILAALGAVTAFRMSHSFALTALCYLLLNFF